MRKADLRKRMEKIRDTIDEREKKLLDQAVKEHLLCWEQYRKATHLFCYVSFRSEINTFPIIEAALMQGKIVSVPRINLKSGEMRAFVIQDTSASLETGAYDILKPVQSCEELDYQKLKLVIAPGLAFTRDGHRLGYGGGFYDRFMERQLERFQGTIVCALTYNRLILDQLPIKDHDIAVDYVITESGVQYAERDNQ
jgi:5-formyltetrahydrofolate cyclo-ligase